MSVRLNGVIYSRYSSDKQQESSIAVQIAECRKFCKANNITVIKEYKDEARTGTDGNREEFQQMLQDAYSGDFDLVIVHRWDRFARNVELALSAQKHLDKLGIKVISTVENFDDTPEGDFFKLMSMGMAALYSKRLSREAFNGQIENAKNCKAHSGVALYGYEVAQKRYRIVPKEAEAIYKMFHLVDEGHTYKETVDILNAEGYRRRDGRPLSYNITDLLRNRQYIGEYVFNLYKRSPCREKWRRQRKPESEVVRIVGGMPQIVETDVFERVQAKLDSRMQKNGRGRKKGKYLLTGLITCGMCGSAVAGGKSVARGKAYFSYVCNGKPKHEGRKSINVVYLDRYIVNLLTQAFLSLRNTDNIILLLRQGITKLHDSQTEKLTDLKKQLIEKEALISSLNDIILKNKGKTLATVISNNITEERNEANRIALIIDEIKAERSSLPRINKETLRKKVLDFKKVLDGIDFYLKQELLQTLIKEIKINVDTVETIINLHELAGLKTPLTCTVYENIDNIRYPFTLRNLEFDFNHLQIQF